MDSPLDNQGCRASDGDVHRVNSASSSSKMHDKVAWPVADKMLHLISQKIVPSGFDTPGFVRNSIVETFGQGHDPMACSTSERDTHGPSAKRKRCSVVDSALGIMGYDAVKVCDTKERFLVHLLTSLVQSTVSCGSVCYYPDGQGTISTRRIQKFHGQICAQRMSVGTFLQIVDNCKSFFASVQYDGTQVLEIVDALVKVATDTSWFAPREESASGIFNKTIYGHSGPRRMDLVWAIQSVLDFALEQKHSVYLKLPPCSRLRFWRIRPSCLKQDISNLANEAMLRLLLRLERELSQREDWATLVVCLSLAPEMFTEARRLLHHWFLSSGAVRLWELRAELVAAVWDVVSHPSLWRLRNEIHLPPKFAGYPGMLRPFVQILEGPPTILGVSRLLKLIDDGEKSRIQPVMEISGQSPLSQCFNDVDHNSIWSLLIEVRPWFIFASRLLFRSFKPDLTSTCEREGYESVVYYGKLEGVLTESEYEGEHLYSQTAARYLAWILSPANRLHRASEEQRLLMFSRSWDKFQEGLLPGTRLLLSGQHDFSALTAAVQASCIKCTRCGSPLKEATNVTGEVSAKEESLDDVGMKSLHTLNHWLATFQRNFGMGVTTLHNEEERCAGLDHPSRMGRSSSIHISGKGKTASFMSHYLPLAAMSERLKTCSFDTVISILQFVASCGSDTSQTNGESKIYESRVQSLPECYSCKILQQKERCCSEDREKRTGPPAASSEADDRAKDFKCRSQVHSKSSLDWLPGVAAALIFLDSLDGDDISLSGCIDPSVVDFKREKIRVTNNLAVIIAQFVQEWAKSIEALSKTSSSLEENTIYISTFKDMLGRFSSWVAKLSINAEAASICNNTKEALAMLVKNEMSSPLTP